MMAALTGKCILQVSLRPEGRQMFVSADGEIDLSAVPSFRQTLQAALSTNPTSMVVDLSRVTYLDSSGIYALLDAWRSMGKEPGSFLIRTGHPSTTHILEIAGLGRLFDTEQTKAV